MTERQLGHWAAMAAWRPHLGPLCCVGVVVVEPRPDQLGQGLGAVPQGLLLVLLALGVEVAAPVGLALLAGRQLLLGLLLAIVLDRDHLHLRHLLALLQLELGLLLHPPLLVVAALEQPAPGAARELAARIRVHQRCRERALMRRVAGRVEGMQLTGRPGDRGRDDEQKRDRKKA